MRTFKFLKRDDLEWHQNLIVCKKLCLQRLEDTS